MKKILTILLLSFLFVGCIDQNIEEKEDLSEYQLEDVNFLLITNPTKEDKSINTTWVKIEEISRNIEEKKLVDEQPIHSTYIERTIPYKSLDTSLLSIKNERNVETKLREVSYKVGESHVFYDFDGSIVNGKLFVEGEYCYIWQDKELEENAKLSIDELREFAEKFDKIYLKQIELCGPKYDGTTIYNNIINPSKKISILMTDISEPNVLGFFSSSNYFKESNFSSGIEVLVGDSVYAKDAIDTKNEGAVFSTMVHEFNHLLNFVNKQLKYDLRQETWYTEMLSMITEDFFMEDFNIEYIGSPQQRLESFISLGYMYGFKNWEEIDSNYVTYNYANAYAFGAFLARNYGGAKLIKEICTNEYVNEESVVHAVNKINGTNKTFNDLLYEFSLILFNTKNLNLQMPSLYKDCSETLNDFDFKLNKIDLSNLPSENNYSILGIRPENLENAYLGAYGFNVVVFDESTDIILKIKDFLFYRVLRLQ